MKTDKTHNCCQLHFATKLPKEKFDILFSDSIDNSELEKNFSSDFQNILLKITPEIGETNFKMTNRIMFCKICSIEIIKTLLYHHINSKEHRDIEKIFVLKLTTYCELCDKEIKNDEWRQHIISQSREDLEEKRYCEVCHMKYDKTYNLSTERNQSDVRCFHPQKNIHHKNQERLDYRSS